MENFQKTISKNLKLSGVGLHSGEVSNINLIPSDEDTGIRFIRNNNTSVASWYNAEVSKLCTKLKIKKYYISTIEHLMSALMGLGITNLIIETNSNEIPILDGSAKIFYEEILKAGLKKQKKKTIKIKIKKKIVYSDNNRYISIEPLDSNDFQIDCTIDYKGTYISKQKYFYEHSFENYKKIYEARTFCLLKDLEKIFAMGLAKGGSLDNAIVVSDNKILNQGGLRYPDEFVRHKILDCIGDLYLSQYPICGKIISYGGGHETNLILLKKIFEKKQNFEYI